MVDGLACLSRKSFVHRDIAARNILLDEDLNCKVRVVGCGVGVFNWCSVSRIGVGRYMDVITPNLCGDLEV